jgi:hypothetical protein
MTIKRSGIIGLADIQNEFGGNAPIGFSEYYRGAGYTSDNNSGVPTSGKISISQFYGAAGHSSAAFPLIVDRKTYYLPSTSYNVINFVCIGGGGGGGGGSSRITYGYGSGGGGGSGAAAFGYFIANPGDQIDIVVGGGGMRGGALDGGGSFSWAGEQAGAGGNSIIYRNGVVQVIAYGGQPGFLSQYNPSYGSTATPGGAVGSMYCTGYATPLFGGGDNGGYGQNGIYWAIGGVGGRGYHIVDNYNMNTSTMYRGAYGSGAIGWYYDAYAPWSRAAITGGGYGGGGSGGGAMMDANNNTYMNGSWGNQGAVAIWW